MPSWTATLAQTFVSEDLASFVVALKVSLALMQQNQEEVGSHGGADCQASPLH